MPQQDNENKRPGGDGSVHNIFHHDHLLEEHQSHFHLLDRLFHHDPHDRSPQGRYRWIYPAVLGYCALLALLALLLDGPAVVWEGLRTICFTPDGLITDYVALAGLGAALINSALVTAAATAVLRLTGAPLGGSTISTLGLMAGFSLFGKDILNIWPIIAGSLLYARFRREPLWKYASTGLMSTTLAPVVSALWFSGLGWKGWVIGTLAGLLIGFLLPLLAAYTFLLLRGMNLYNVGFACGLMSMMLVPIMASAGVGPATVLVWASDATPFFTALLISLSLLALAAGVILSGGVRQAWESYRALLSASGAPPSDFLTAFGGGAVLVNIGVMGLLSTGYILLIGGDLNGPTVGAILTVVGFAANGKHPRNSVPITLGLALGAVLLPGFAPADPSIQFCALFCTTLAPFCGTFGCWAGVLAGFLHGCLVQRTGAVVCGLNLYNNGFVGGIVSMVLYPLMVFLRLRHPAGSRDEDLAELSAHAHREH